MTVADATFKQTLRGLLRRWDEADQAVAASQAASADADREKANRARLEAEGCIWALQHDLSDLLFMLLRCAVEHEPRRLRDYLMELLAPEVGLLVKEILKERGRR
jgi:hypothetical protein